jgi:hypothetical protein
MSKLMADLPPDVRWMLYEATWTLRGSMPNGAPWRSYRVPVPSDVQDIVPVFPETVPVDILYNTLRFTFDRLSYCHEGEVYKWANVLWSGIVVDWVPLEWTT